MRYAYLVLVFLYSCSSSNACQHSKPAAQQEVSSPSKQESAETEGSPAKFPTSELSKKLESVLKDRKQNLSDDFQIEGCLHQDSTNGSEYGLTLKRVGEPSTGGEGQETYPIRLSYHFHRNCCHNVEPKLSFDETSDCSEEPNINTSCNTKNARLEIKLSGDLCRCTCDAKVQKTLYLEAGKYTFKVIHIGEESEKEITTKELTLP
jgi:hypothetical protein